MTKGTTILVLKDTCLTVDLFFIIFRAGRCCRLGF